MHFINNPGDSHDTDIAGLKSYMDVQYSGQNGTIHANRIPTGRMENLLISIMVPELSRVS